ncbi:MAG: HAD family phosphatase [Treponema sp.]|nr:HAD family phosphatase [Candidatus Treponema equifaecale]
MALTFRNISFDCAIFDMDGTLLDSMPMWHFASNKYLIGKGKTPQDGLWDIVKRLNMIETAEYLINTYGLSETVEQVCDEIRIQLITEYEENLQLKPGSLELLQLLNEKKIPCILATATDRKCTVTCMKRLGVEKYFTSILTCLDFNTSKSKPLIFEKAAEAGNSIPENSLVFEDALHCVRTAHNAKFKVCACYDSSDEEITEPPESDWQRIVKLADTTIQSLEEVVKGLK